MQWSKILPVLLIVGPAVAIVGSHGVIGAPAAEECKAAPGGATPRGSHWFYRINRTTKQHCWYLGPVNARVIAHGTGADASAPAPNAATGVATDGPPPAQPAPMPDAATAPPIMMMPSSPQIANAVVPPVPSMAFTQRWPNALPAPEDLHENDPPAVSESYAESSEANADATQLPARWPIADNDQGRETPTGDSTLRYFAVAGIGAMTALLVVGLLTQLVRHPLYRRLREYLRRRRIARARRMSAEGSATAEPTRRARTEWRRTPTDPADDLKASLAELMRDLRRAASASDMAESSARNDRYARGQRAGRVFGLQAAE